MQLAGAIWLKEEFMVQERLLVDGELLCKGVQQATSRSEEPILCLIKADTMRFVAVSGLRLVITWETRLPEPAPRNLAFLIPPVVAQLLSCDAVCSQVGIELATGESEVVARLTDHLGSYEIRWRSDLSMFPAPEAFGQIIAVPESLIEVPYLRFSDATHHAVAKLVRMEADEQISPTKLAILIDLDFGGLRIDGEEIVFTESRQYYYDPRLVIRALEFMKERNLHVGITPLPGEVRAYLSMLTRDDEWTVHCSLLSIGKDTQKLYPLPPGRNR
jgi:hypothetical protein